MAMELSTLCTARGYQRLAASLDERGKETLERVMPQLEVNAADLAGSNNIDAALRILRTTVPALKCAGLDRDKLEALYEGYVERQQSTTAHEDDGSSHHADTGSARCDAGSIPCEEPGSTPHANSAEDKPVSAGCDYYDYLSPANGPMRRPILYKGSGKGGKRDKGGKGVQGGIKRSRGQSDDDSGEDNEVFRRAEKPNSAAAGKAMTENGTDFSKDVLCACHQAVMAANIKLNRDSRGTRNLVSLMGSSQNNPKKLMMTLCMTDVYTKALNASLDSQGFSMLHSSAAHARIFKQKHKQAAVRCVQSCIDAMAGPENDGCAIQTEFGCYNKDPTWTKVLLQNVKGADRRAALCSAYSTAKSNERHAHRAKAQKCTTTLAAEETATQDSGEVHVPLATVTQDSGEVPAPLASAVDADQLGELQGQEDSGDDDEGAMEGALPSTDHDGTDSNADKSTVPGSVEATQGQSEVATEEAIGEPPEITSMDYHMCVDYGAIIKAVVPSTSSTSVSMLNISQLKKAFKVISEAALTKGRNDNQLAIEKVNI